MLNMKKILLTSILSLVFVLFCTSVSYAEAGIFTDLSDRTTDFAVGLRNLAYVISGFGIVMFSENISNIPEGCSNFVNLDSDNATIFKDEMDENNIVRFIPEYLDDKVQFKKYLTKINNIPFKVNNEIFPS